MQKLVEEAETYLVRIKDAEGSRKIAEREIAFLFVEQGNAPDWLLRPAAGLFEDDVAKLETTLFELLRLNVEISDVRIIQRSFLGEVRVADDTDIREGRLFAFPRPLENWQTSSRLLVCHPFFIAAP